MAIFRGQNGAVILGLLTLALAAQGCKSKSKDDDEGDENTVSSTGGGGSSSGNRTGGSLNVSIKSAGAGAALRLVGQADSAHLESLKYMIGDITICKNLTVNGSGHSGGEGCLTIYANRDNNDAPASEGGATGQELYDYAQASDADHIDLMDPESVAKLSAALQIDSSHVGIYKFATITWFPVIKLTAEVPFLGGDEAMSLFTKDAVPQTITSGVDNRVSFATHVDAITTGPAEEAMVVSPNGGNWFSFAKPLEITEADIDDKVDYALDLAFNPDYVVKGVVGNSGEIIEGTGPYPTDGDPNPVYAIKLPMLALTPIAHRASESVAREEYVLDIGGERPHKRRVHLYYVAEDATKAVRGVEMQTIFTEDTPSDPGEADKAYKVTEGDDGVVIENSNNDKLFVDFVRLEAAGDTGVLKVVKFDPVTGAATEVETPYTLEAVTTLP